MSKSPRAESGEKIQKKVMLILLIFGIVAAGILSLFFLVQLTKRRNLEATRSAFIASGILDTLKVENGHGSLRFPSGMTNGTPIWDLFNPTARKVVSILFDSSCHPMRVIPTEEADLPQLDPYASSVVTLDLYPSSSPLTSFKVEVDVAFPSSVTSAKRSVHQFVRLITIP